MAGFNWRFVICWSCSKRSPFPSSTLSLSSNPFDILVVANVNNSLILLALYCFFVSFPRRASLFSSVFFRNAFRWVLGHFLCLWGPVGWEPFFSSLLIDLLNPRLFPFDYVPFEAWILFCNFFGLSLSSSGMLAIFPWRGVCSDSTWSPYLTSSFWEENALFYRPNIFPLTQYPSIISSLISIARFPKGRNSENLPSYTFFCNIRKFSPDIEPLCFNFPSRKKSNLPEWSFKR